MQSVLKISEAASIALHAMSYVALNDGTPVSNKSIANNFGISVNHLSKVLQRLVKANLLRSTKGPSGGFEIVKSSKEITFLEIYEAIDGKLPTCSCLFGRSTCPFKVCIMGNLLNNTNKMVRDFLENKKLSDFYDKI